MNAPNLRFKDENGKDYPEWKSQKLRDFSEIKTGPFGSLLHAGDYISDGHPIITTEHFKNGYLPDIKFNIPQVSDKSYNELNPYILNENDIVFSRVGSVDINALVTKNQAGWLFSGRVLRVRTKGHNQNFVHYALTTKHVRKNILSRAVGQTMPSINTEILSDTVINLPSNIDEEKKISDFFFELDRLIQITTKKLKSLEQIKKGFLQKIFSQQIRFKDENSKNYPDWKEIRLGDFTQRVTEKNINLESDLPLTISAKYGLVDQRKFFSKQIASKNLSGYYIINNGDFAYNKSTSVEAPYGAVRRLDLYKKGVVSTLYICFKLTNKDIYSDYLVQYFKSSKWEKSIKGIASEGARNHGMLNISTNDFFNTIHIIPSYKEQVKIARFLNSFDLYIQGLTKRLQSIESIKISLLQQMFI